MKNVFLLTGIPGSGKTTVIRKIVSRLSCEVGGFYTEEIRESGTRTGFRLITLDGRQGVLAHVNIRQAPHISRYGVDLAVLDDIGVDCLTRAIAEMDVVVIDEIGPMELLSKNFRRVVLRALESDVVVLGSIVKRRTSYTEVIKEHPSVHVIEITRANHDKILAYVLGLIQETGHCEVI